MKNVILKNIGWIPYLKAWDMQKALLAEVIDIKRYNRDNSADKHLPIKHYFLFCEHPHVYTLGRSGSPDNLLLNKTQLEEKAAEFHKINRGGDITYHGPGQIVGYPILDLDHFFTDIHKFVRYIEEAVIRTLAEYDIEAERIKGLSGVWLQKENSSQKRKICAVGIHLSRWVTMHGFALNINTNLNYFDYIIPCGIVDKDKGVTSLQQELGYSVDVEDVKIKLKRHFSDLFGMNFVQETVKQA